MFRLAVGATSWNIITVVLSAALRSGVAELRWILSDCYLDRLSTSQEHEAYEQEMAAHGQVLVGNDQDDGGNYYYFATKS